MLQEILIVNKEHQLEEDYVPKDLVVLDENENNFHQYIDPTLKPMVSATIVADLKELQAFGEECGYHFIADSGYRSYAYQQRVWDSFVERIGLEATKKRVAVPGSSEHQTGLAIDFAVIRNGEYHDSLTKKEVLWLSEHAYKFGFILRYPKGKENITGYGYEGWHYRHVGKRLAKYLYENSLTLEEYFLEYEDKMKEMTPRKEKKLNIG